MALASQQTPDGLVVVAVVCDGVSSSARPDEASHVAASAALPVLVAAVQSDSDLAEASRAAVMAGRQSVAGLQEPANERSATTFVSAVAGRDRVTLCWLGDSRAYWLTERRPTRRCSPTTTPWPAAWSRPAWPRKRSPWPRRTHTC